MELNIKDISGLLMTSEKEVRSLVKKHAIPHQIINDKELFNKQQIIEWALIRNIPLNLSNNHKLEEYQVWSLSSVLSKESFLYNCDIDEKNYIDEMVNLIDIENNVDKGIIVQLLKNREELMSTAIGNGISIPHPRIPLMVGKDKPLISFFFPISPINLKSIDGKPVHTIILLISQTIKLHLSLLAQLSYLLMNVTFQFALKNRLNQDEILNIIGEIEKTRSL